MTGAQETAKLRRDIGHVGAAFLVLNSVIGAGISGLAGCSFPRRFSFKGSKCAEQPVLNLLEAVPELPEALTAFLARPDLTTKDKRLATELESCLEQFTGADSGSAEPTPSVSPSSSGGG